MTDTLTYEEAEAKMREAGAEHGRNAASWVLDGNSSPEQAAWLLKGIEDGDPMILDQLPSSPLSGEWADESTPASVFRDVLGLDLHETEGCGLSTFENAPDSFVTDELLNAYEDAFYSASQDEVARLAKTYLD